MSDAVSKKPILEWVYENGYFSLRAADMLADEFEKGTFDIPSPEEGRNYTNGLYFSPDKLDELSKRMRTIPVDGEGRTVEVGYSDMFVRATITKLIADHRTLSAAEGRYREALERIIDVLADDTSIRAQRINNIIITALSPSGEQKEKRKCMACNGSGHYDSHGSPPCGACDGTGWEEDGE